MNDEENLSSIEYVENQETINKRFKVKEIQRLKEENKDTNFRILLNGGGIILSMSLLVLLVLDNRDIPKEEVFSKINNALRIVSSFSAVKFFGGLLKELLRKCKCVGVIEYLENLDKNDLDEQLEEKGRSI